MAFNILKETFISNVIFCHYNSDYKIVIKIDALNYVFRDILSQYNENGILYSIIHFLKKHNLAECNYKLYNKKLIIIIYIFKE